MNIDSLSLSIPHVYVLSNWSQTFTDHEKAHICAIKIHVSSLPWVPAVAEFLFQKLTLMTFISGIVHQKLAQNPCHSLAFGGQQSLAVSFGGAQGEHPQMFTPQVDGATN